VGVAWHLELRRRGGGGGGALGGGCILLVHAGALGVRRVGRSCLCPLATSSSTGLLARLTAHARAVLTLTSPTQLNPGIESDPGTCGAGQDWHWPGQHKPEKI
jgi:hypothetical protein